MRELVRVLDAPFCMLIDVVIRKEEIQMSSMSSKSVSVSGGLDGLAPPDQTRVAGLLTFGFIQARDPLEKFTRGTSSAFGFSLFKLANEWLMGAVVRE